MQELGRWCGFCLINATCEKRSSPLVKRYNISDLPRHEDRGDEPRGIRSTEYQYP
ncbi:rRNA processing/ribosome biogenesis domain-containing protein [Cordyceps javanica]|nr:rRNA processing/ribosome biogenesis domain-containing protein [Cordyceps javanica]